MRELANFLKIEADNSQQRQRRQITIMYRTMVLNALYDLKKGCPQAKRFLRTVADEELWYANLERDTLERIVSWVEQNDMPPYKMWRYQWSDSVRGQHAA